MTSIQVQPFDRSINSELIDFKGTVSWVQAVDLNKYGKWSIRFYPDTEGLESIRELQARGIKNIMKKDKDEDGGRYYVQISRPPQVEFSKGVFTPVTPPKIRDKNKQPMDGREIGDGSDVIVTCEKYGYTVPQSKQKGTAIRFYGLTVLNLIPKAVVEPEPQAEAAGWD